MATVIEAGERVNKVLVEGLAMLKIVKHCHDSLPQVVTGTLLGLAVDGVMEVTHAFPSPDGASAGNKDEDADAGQEDFQVEMMRMLREVNVDNNCVGWYQSMYLGIHSTSEILENQYSYQTDLSPNAVVLLYDPLQTTNGNFCLKAYRLSEDCLEMKRNGTNDFLDPSKIFEEIPVECSNSHLISAALTQFMPSPLEKSSANIELDRLNLTAHPYLEKQLEYLCGWVDDLAGEYHKFQVHTRQLSRTNNKTSEGWAQKDAPQRMESLLVSNQIESYCDQLDKYVEDGLSKLFLTAGLHEDEGAKASK